MYAPLEMPSPLDRQAGRMPGDISTIDDIMNSTPGWATQSKLRLL
jgi:hypothetical protein